MKFNELEEYLKEQSSELEIQRLRSLYYIINSLYKMNLYGLDKASQKDTHFVRTLKRIKDILLDAIKNQE